MKRLIPILLSIALVAVATACSISTPGKAGLSPTAVTPSPGPTPSELEEGFVPGIAVPYSTIVPVNPGDADEIRIALPERMEQPCVLAMPDGGALALGQKVERGALKKVTSSKVMAARYDSTGKALWTKVYDELTDGYVGQARPMSGGGYAFTVNGLAIYQSGQSEQYHADIVVCGADGSIAYHEPRIQTGLYQHILDCDTGLCVVGDGGYQNGKLVGDALTQGNENALTVLAQGPISSVFFSRNARADGYFSPMAAVWSKETGLVVAAYKDDIGDGRTSGLLAYDTATLKEKWRYGGDTPAHTIFEGLFPTAGGTLVNGYTGGKTFIMKLSPEGKKLWQIDPDGSGEYAVIAMAAYPDGTFAAAVNRYQEGDSMRGIYLAKYGEAGVMHKKLLLAGETMTSIQPLDDGGLITVARQNKKVLPAPAYVSSIWFDTETIVTRYDKELNVQWRKVYDQYPDSRQVDVAVATCDGMIIVED